MARQERPQNEQLLTYIKEQNRKQDVLIELTRQAQKLQARGGLGQVGVAPPTAAGPATGAARAGLTGARLAGGAPAGGGGLAAGIGGAAGVVLGAIGEAVKNGVLQGLQGRAAAIRGASGLENADVVAARAGLEGRKGFVEGVLGSVPLVGQELAARNDFRVRQKLAVGESAREFAKQQTLSTFGEAAAAGVNIDDEVLKNFLRVQENRGRNEAEFQKRVNTLQAASKITAYANVNAIGSLSLGQ